MALTKWFAVLGFFRGVDWVYLLFDAVLHDLETR